MAKDKVAKFKSFKRNIGIALGGFIITFLLVFSIIIPIINNKQEDIESNDNKALPIGDEPPDGYILIDRNYTTNTYYNSVSGQYYQSGHLNYINYKNEIGVFNPINTTFETLDSDHPAYSYGYRVGNEKGIFSTYFKHNPTSNYPIAYAYNRSSNPTQHVLRIEPVGFAYLDPSNDNDYSFIQYPQDITGTNNGSFLEWHGIYSGVSDRWYYQNSQLKEEMYLSNQTKTVLQNNPPSDFGFSNQESYLVNVYKLDYTGLTVYNDTDVEIMNITFNTSSMVFKNALGEVMFVMPIGYAYEQYNRSSYNNMINRLINKDGEYYLLSGIKVTKLNQMSFPVVLDPSTGATGAGTIVSTMDGFNVDWSNPSNADTDDSNYASANIYIAITDWLDADNFGFSIGSEYAIDGIVATYDKMNNVIVSGNILDDDVYLLDEGSQTGDNKAETARNWDTSKETRTYGASDDDWGKSGGWTYDEINHADFGIRFSCHSTGIVQAQVYYLTLNVYYSTATYPPTITSTREADNLATDGLRSGGTGLDDGGASITAKGIRYGISSPPGTNSASSGTGESDYYTTISSLNENDLYYFRAYATNAEGTTYCDDINSASTLIGPPTTGELDVSAVTTSSITLTIDPDPPRDTEGDTGVWYDGVSGTGVGSSVAWETFDTESWEDTGLSENSPYVYRAKFQNRVGTDTAYSSNDDTVYTYANQPEDNELIIDSYGADWIYVKVLDVDNNPEGGNTGGYIECGASNSGWITSSTGGYYVYNFTGLTEGTVYGIRAKYQNGDSVSTEYTNYTYIMTNPDVVLSGDSAVWFNTTNTYEYDIDGDGQSDGTPAIEITNNHGSTVGVNITLSAVPGSNVHLKYNDGSFVTRPYMANTTESPIIYVACGDQDGQHRPENDNLVYCLSGINGSIMWLYETDGYTNSMNSIGLDDEIGRLFMGVYCFSDVDQCGFYCLNATPSSAISDSTRTIWNTSSQGGRKFSSPAIGDDYVYFGTHAGVGVADHVWALAKSTGTKSWSIGEFEDPDDTVYSQMAIGSGVLVFGCDDGYVYAYGTLASEYNARNSSEDWTNWDMFGYDNKLNSVIETNGLISSNQLWKHNDIGSGGSNPDQFAGVVIHNNSVYSVSKEYDGDGTQNLTCRELNTGELNWRIDLGKDVDDTPCFYNHPTLGEVIYVQTYGGSADVLRCVNASDGGSRWSADTEHDGSGKSGSPIIVPEYDAIISSNDGHVEWFNATTGSSLRDKTVSGGTVGTASYADDTVYFVSSGETPYFYGWDISTGNERFSPTALSKMWDTSPTIWNGNPDDDYYAGEWLFDTDYEIMTETIYLGTLAADATLDLYLWSDFDNVASIDTTRIMNITLDASDGENISYGEYNINFNKELPATAPVISNPSPTNGSSRTVTTKSTVSADISDANSDSMTWTIQTSPDIGQNSGTTTDASVDCSIAGNLTSGTTYTWYLNVTDGSLWDREWYTFTVNYPVSLSFETPTNGTTNVPTSNTTLNVTITDTDGDTMNWTIQSHVGSSSDTGNSSGDNINVDISGNLSLDTTYTWWVNISDGYQYTREWYTFTTSEGITTSVDTISPYNTSTNPLQIDVSTVGGDPDNVTLWYRNSTGNGTGGAGTTAWWDDGVYNWTYRKLLTIDHDQVDSTLTNLPVIISVIDNDLSSYSQEDGDDIVFIDYSDNSTKLSHEIEYYSSGSLSAWVNVTTVSCDEDTLIWMYYGNDTCDSQEDITGTWDSNYLGIWHFGNTNNLGVDSTYINNLTNQDSASSCTGILGYGANFATAGARLISNSYTYVFADEITLECWYDIRSSASSYPRTVELSIAGGSNSHALAPDPVGDSTIRAWFENSAGTRVGTTDSDPTTYDTGFYHYSVATFDGGEGIESYLYINGSVSDSTDDAATNLYDTQYIHLGAFYDGSNDFDGYIDEVRVSNIRRTPDWIIACYNMVVNSSTFVTFDENESYSAGGDDWSDWMEWDDASNPDDSSPFDFDFDFPNSTGYYEFYSIGNVSGTPETAPGSADAICNYTYVTPAITWQTVNDTFNGQFTNSTSYKIVDESFNGVFTNSTSWNTISDGFNGIFTNSTSWNTISDGFNGIFTNSTSWSTVSDSFNGLFYNSTSWSTVSDDFNGTFTNTSVPDTTIPSITINFAGNLSDSGGPYWRPPGESTQLSGAWSDGYYTNDSRQSENFTYINLTISEPESDIDNVWLNWYNESGDSWINWTAPFVNRTGGYWDINSSDYLDAYSGHNYSFDIVANNSDSGSNWTAWNKTILGGGYARRYVQLNCSSTDNISYTPYYFKNILPWLGVGDYNKKDRLNNDQGADGTGSSDTVFLVSDVPATTVSAPSCAAFLGGFWSEQVSTDFTLENIYFHLWLSDSSETRTSIGWNMNRAELNNTLTDFYSDTKTNSRSDLEVEEGYFLGENWVYLTTNLLDVTDTKITDNNVYEMTIKFVDANTPGLWCNRSINSFVLFNVPSNETLNATGDGDTDSDGLFDYDELWTYYTNPFLTDTDNDGIDDYWETQAGSDPNNYTETFNISITWQTVNDTFNGQFTNSTNWEIIDETFNGIFVNSTSWSTVDSDFNGIFTNSTVWEAISDTFNGVFSNTTVLTWQTVNDTYNGVFTNSSQWQTISDSFNGLFINSTSWYTVSDTFNGIFYNSTTWNTIDSTYNGLFSNSTAWQITSQDYNGVFINTSDWQIINQDFNGIFINATEWYIVNQDYNGIFSNSSFWKSISESFNGIFTNSSSWFSVSDSFNGIFTNGTEWRIIDNAFNGLFSNSTSWRIVDNAYNGIFTNTTVISWQTINETFNGIFTNSSNWNIISESYNGIFNNATDWQIVNQDFGGIFTNSTNWYTISNTFNGVFTNTSIWVTISDDYNGIFTNTTTITWQTVNDTFNGLFSNGTEWQIIDSTFNGIFTNSTSFKLVNQDYNGIFLNTTSWAIVDNTFNGIFVNSTAWTIVNNAFNGVFNNATVLSWQMINNTFNGIFSNVTTWYTIDETFNGLFSNSTNWLTISDSFNGQFVNSTQWNIINEDYNGIFTNTTVISWQTVNDTFNGIFTNSTSWTIIDETFNGVFTNTTVLTWQTVDTDFNGIFTNATILAWQTIDEDFNGIFSNGTAWQTIDSNYNGVFTNISITWNIVNQSFNGTFINMSGAWTIINQDYNGIFNNITIAYINITNVYPANNSNNIQLQPTLYLTISNLQGLPMNVTWYVGTNSSDINTLIGTDTNIGNGSIYKQYVQATANFTTYYWRINATDETHTVEYIYHFKTAKTVSIVMIGGDGNGLAFAVIGLFGIFGLLGFIKMRKKKNY